MQKGQDIAKDLLNLEINAILVDGISSRKMPEVKVVLQEIAEKYELFLKRTVNRTNSAIEDAGLENKVQKVVVASQEESEVDSQSQLFPERLGTLAKTLLETRDKARKEGLFFDREIANVLRRVNKNCRVISDIIAKKPSLNLTAAELMSVRKIWEVGVERVVMQTVVQLDGDIVTRIQIGRETARNKILHDMHEELVGLAIGNWQFMVTTLTNLLKSSLKAIF